MAPSSHRGGNAIEAGLTSLSHGKHAVDRSCEMTEVVTQAVLEINDRVEMDMPFMNLGVDSLGAAELSSRMSTLLNRSFGPNLIFNFPSIRQLGMHLGSLFSAAAPHDALKQEASRRSATASGLQPIILSATFTLPGGMPRGVIGLSVAVL